MPYSYRGALRRKLRSRAPCGFCRRTARDCHAPRGGGRSGACRVPSMERLPVLFCVFYTLVRPLLRYLGQISLCQRHPSRSRSACRRYAWNKRTFSKDTVRTALRCASARLSLPKYRRARWRRKQLPIPPPGFSCRGGTFDRGQAHYCVCRVGFGPQRMFTLSLGCFVVSFPSGMLTHVPRIGKLRQRRRCAWLWQQEPCSTSTKSRIWWANKRRRYGRSKRTFKNLPSDLCSARDVFVLDFTHIASILSQPGYPNDFSPHCVSSAPSLTMAILQLVDVYASLLSLTKLMTDLRCPVARRYHSLHRS